MRRLRARENKWRHAVLQNNLVRMFQHVIDELMKSKLLFIETNDALETSVALEKHVHW